MQPAARTGDCICHGGAVASGSEDVYINGISAAYTASVSTCVIHGGGCVASGSGSVYINGHSAARCGDVSHCGSVIAAGSEDVYVGD